MLECYGILNDKKDVVNFWENSVFCLFLRNFVWDIVERNILFIMLSLVIFWKWIFVDWDLFVIWFLCYYVMIILNVFVCFCKY